MICIEKRKKRMGFYDENASKYGKVLLNTLWDDILDRICAKQSSNYEESYTK